MELCTLGQVIAERRYVLSTALGSKEEVIFRLGVPQKSPDRSDCFCPFEIFEIVGFGATKIKCAFGIDAFQALRLTVKMIGVDRTIIVRATDSGLYLFEEGDDLDT